MSDLDLLRDQVLALRDELSNLRIELYTVRAKVDRLRGTGCRRNRWTTPSWRAVVPLATYERPHKIPGRVLEMLYSVDGFGQYIVQEPLASTYGVGVTPQAAVADFRRAGWARLEVLARHRDQLSVRMAQELAALERIFRG